MNRFRLLHAVALVGTLSGSMAFAQSARPTTETLDPRTSEGQAGVFKVFIDGKVRDLSTDSLGRVLYCTEEGEVGYFTAAGKKTVLATALTGPFPEELRAVAENDVGDVAVLDDEGDIYELLGGATPAVLQYDDLYMVVDPTDLLADAAGNYTAASRTPTDGTRGVNRISSDGARWGYYLVEHTPVQLAHDPLTGDLLMADEDAGGVLRLIDTVDTTRPTTIVDDTTLFGFTVDNDDGDMACEADGDVLLVAGGDVYRHERVGGTTSVLLGGFGQLRGIAIAASSGRVPSSSGWSAYVAEGSSPTRIVEIPNVDAPAPALTPNLGFVSGRGTKVKVYSPGLRVYDLAVDNDGHLLVGGDVFGTDYAVHRIELPSLTETVVADDSDGLTGRIEGIAVAADDTIYAMTTSGLIHEITEDPVVVTTEWSDPLDNITAGKDMIIDVNGDFYIADRNGWGWGEIHMVSSGTPTFLVATDESRGLAADPAGGAIYVSEWVSTGFDGTVGRFTLGSGSVTDLPGFDGINISNDSVWGDGDLTVDVNGNVYSLSEDDWSLLRYMENAQGFERVGSGYVDHPSGVVIAQSSTGSGSTTGWSLYITEYTHLFEKPSYPAPASAVLDPSGGGMSVVVGGIDPRRGLPRDMLVAPADAWGGEGTGLLVSTSGGSLLRVDLESGETALAADRLHGLAGDLVALAERDLGGGRREVLAASRDGTVYALDPRAGYTAHVLHGNEPRVLGDVRGITVDDRGRVLIVDRATDVTAGGLYRLGEIGLRRLASTTRGLRPGLDPVTGEILITEAGDRPGGGRIRSLRAGAGFGARGGGRARTRHLGFRLGGPGRGSADGDLAFDATGDYYVTTAGDGRVLHVDRESGARRIVAGGHARPTALETLGRGDDQRLFLLDGWTVFELETDGADAARTLHRGAQLPELAPVELKPRTVRGGWRNRSRR